MRIGEDLYDAMMMGGKNVASFVVKRDDGGSDGVCQGKERRSNGGGDGKFAAGIGIDFIFDAFEETVTGHELANFFGEFDLAPRCRVDVVGGVN